MVGVLGVESVGAPGSLGSILWSIRAGKARSRSSLVRATGLAPSTISQRVDTLVRLGLIEDHGDEESRGGRRAKRLRLVAEAGSVAAIEIGAHHVTIAIADLGGRILTQRVSDSIDSDPQGFVAEMWTGIDQLAAESGGGPLLGIGIGAPAPIDHPSGCMVHPSFMPAWDRLDLPVLLASRTTVPVLVENDANLMALAETANDPGQTTQHLLAVKLGSRIGCGIVSQGRLHRGRRGAAGEISHTPVVGESSISCICAAPNCLESVASGGALVARLAAAGLPVRTPADIVELGHAGDVRVNDALRHAGTLIGGALASFVNFFNPGDVVLGGTMSASAPLVAAIRAELFRCCLPIAADELDIRAVRDPETSGIRGAVRLILEEVLSPARIDELARSGVAESA